MAGFFLRPLKWLLVPVGGLLVATMGFAIFQPVKVVPRIAAGPSYELIDQNGQLITEQSFAGKIVLYGFGYTNDPTGVIDRIIADMGRIQVAAQNLSVDADIALALVLFDNQRDTPERRREFAAERGLDLTNWVLLSGDGEALKQMVGQGFGIYYESVPLEELASAELISISSAASGGYGYLQAERYVLVDDMNTIRAEYHIPLDLERLMRDIRLIIREKNSAGAERALNEAAHLFLCYPD
jgi:protein SCO1/2